MHLSTDCGCASLAQDMVNTDIESLPIWTNLRRVYCRSPCPRYYRCVVCDTIWQDSLEPFMHADVAVVARTRLDAYGAPVAVHFDLSRHGRERIG